MGYMEKSGSRLPALKNMIHHVAGKLTKSKHIIRFIHSIPRTHLWGPSYNILVAQSVFVLIFLIADVFFARSFSKTQFAVWKQINLIRVLIVPMIAFGFPEGFKYYLALEADKKQLHLSIIFNILCLITLFFSLLHFSKVPQYFNTFFRTQVFPPLLYTSPLYFSFLPLTRYSGT